MAVPTFTWSAAFGSLPDDPTPTWNADLSENVGTNTYGRGKAFDLDRIEAGSGKLELLDDEGDYDPRNASSPWYPYVRPMVPIRQTATLAGTDYPLCSHFVSHWPRHRQAAFITRSLSTVDGFEILATASVAGMTLAAGGAGAQVADILDYIGWPAALRDIATGSASLIEQTFADNDSTRALPLLQEIAANEAGLLFMDGEGKVVFVGRNDLLGPPFNEIQAHFSDDSADGQFIYVDSTPYFALDRVFNDWTGSRPGGDPQNVQDSDSIDKYRRRSRSMNTRLTSDSDVLNTVQHYLSLYREPLERLQSITFAPGEESAAWVAVFGLEIGDRIAVTETPPYGGKRTDDYLIEGLTFNRAPGSDAGATVTYALIPATIPGAVELGLIFDDAALGKLDTAVLGF